MGGGHGHGDMDAPSPTGEYHVDWGNAAAHLFFGLPVMVYGHLIALDAYNSLGKGRKLAKWGEGTFLIVFGFLIFALDIIGYMGCSPDGNMCKDINIMHMLFGLFMMAVGIVLLMHVYMRTFTRGSLWMTPICLVVVGVFMTQHEQGGHDEGYGRFIHTAFGIVAIAAALLRALCLIDPQRWAIFTAYASSITALTFVTGSDIMDYLLRQRAGLMAHTVLLGVVALSTVLLVPLMMYISWMNGGVAPKGATSSKFVDEDDDIPLVNGKF